MSFAPVIPLGGYAGWTFLKRTMAAQKTAFQANPATQRDEDYFRQKIGSVHTAEALVSDRRLLKVALGAHGLDADLGNKFFIRKVLEDGTLKTGALANRLADKQYAALSSAFGFGDYNTPRTQLSDFADTILADYRTRQFEAAVGEGNSDMRLALNAERELASLAGKSLSEDGKWFTILGSKALRTVFETAFGLPASFGAIDLDQQVSTMKVKAAALMGDSGVNQFAESAQVEKLLRRFLVRSESAAGGISPLAKGAGALQILSGGQTNTSALLLAQLNPTAQR